jgi:hypothetical protein
MDKPLGEHIRRLQEKREQIGVAIMQETNKTRRNHLESQLRAIESALTLYRSALEIEERVLEPE